MASFPHLVKCIPSRCNLIILNNNILDLRIKQLFLARLYEGTGRAIAVTPASALTSASALLKC